MVIFHSYGDVYQRVWHLWSLFGIMVKPLLNYHLRCLLNFANPRIPYFRHWTAWVFPQDFRVTNPPKNDGTPFLWEQYGSSIFMGCQYFSERHNLLKNHLFYHWIQNEAFPMVPWSVIKVVPDVLRFSAPLSLKAWKRGVHQQPMGVEYYPLVI